ncbi:MAG: carboxypeptidase regulatory-like domain-containing protein, partial [Fibrobacter sp.]|nr:carboxypeptidase regulatory-like domain-containing protein [Fibrobacter sp.]
MYRKIMTLLVLNTIVTVSAQTINIRGKVTIKDGKPLAGAVVSLLGRRLSDTTDVSGQYSIQDNSTKAQWGVNLPVSQKVTMYNGVLKFKLITTSYIKIGFFDLKGKQLLNVIKQNVSAGEYRFDVKEHHLAGTAMIVSVLIGNISSTFRFIPVGNLSAGNNTAMVGRENMLQKGKLFKLNAVVDSLKVTAQNYVSYVTTLPSYTEEINVTLDSIALPKFSFFVTSQKALQELAKNVNGFGGDLRFGKTGTGAGLRGADSICECIAEKSMPGSKVKVWRAFLSISKDENGNPVHAVDRIGNGPWYDRMGRLLAPTLSDLIKARPANGDPTIKNDLP